MADLGAIVRANGRIPTAAYVVKFPLLWQTTGKLGAIPNGYKEDAFYALWNPLVWQKSGQGNLGYRVMPNAWPPASLYFIPWYQWLPGNGSLPLQKAYDCNGSIYGKVTIAGIRTPNARVTLMDGLEFDVVGMEFSNATGDYRFDGLPKSYTNFTILVDDPTGQYNQGRLDNLTPV